MKEEGGTRIGVWGMGVVGLENCPSWGTWKGIRWL